MVVGFVAVDVRLRSETRRSLGESTSVKVSRSLPQSARCFGVCWISCTIRSELPKRCGDGVLCMTMSTSICIGEGDRKTKLDFGSTEEVRCSIICERMAGAELLVCSSLFLATLPVLCFILRDMSCVIGLEVVLLASRCGRERSVGCGCDLTTGSWDTCRLDLLDDSDLGFDDDATAIDRATREEADGFLEWPFVGSTLFCRFAGLVAFVPMAGFESKDSAASCGSSPDESGNSSDLDSGLGLFILAVGLMIGV